MKRYKSFAGDLSVFDLSLSGAFFLALSSLFLTITPINVDKASDVVFKPETFFFYLFFFLFFKRKPNSCGRELAKHTKCGIGDNVSV